MSVLSERLRPDVECAPWVIEEVRKLEAVLAKLREQKLTREPVGTFKKQYWIPGSPGVVILHMEKEATMRDGDYVYAAPLPAVVQVPREALWGLFNEHNTPMKTRDAVLALLAGALQQEASDRSQLPQEWRETIQGAIDELPYQHHLIPRLTAMLAAAPEAQAQPPVPAPWREAVKVMREALEEAAQVFDLHDAGFKVITDAIALADSLEGGE